MPQELNEQVVFWFGLNSFIYFYLLSSKSLNFPSPYFSEQLLLARKFGFFSPSKIPGAKISKEIQNQKPEENDEK